MQYSFITTSLLYVYKAGHGPTDFLNRVKTTERSMRIWNNDQRLLVMYFLLMIYYINLRLTLAISAMVIFPLDFFMSLTSVQFITIKFWNVFLYTVD